MVVAIIIVSVAVVLAFAMFAFTAVLFDKIMGRSGELLPDEADAMYKKLGLEPYKDMFIDGFEFIKEKSGETVYTEAFDGIKLAAICVPCENARGTVLMMHGFRSAPEWDFSCAVKSFYSLGLNVVMPYQRAHGKSEGRYLSFGVNERKDVRSWIEWIKARFGADGDIFVDGVSMGCATVLMGGGDDGYPENVRGIIADCGYTSPYEIVTHVMKNKMHIPRYPFIWFFRLLCKVKGGFSLTEYSPIEAVKVNRTPVIFFHGDADDFVPYEMSVRNHEACVAEKEFVSVKGAGHGLSYLVDRELCEKRLSDFIERNLRA